MKRSLKKVPFSNEFNESAKTEINRSRETQKNSSTLKSGESQTIGPVKPLTSVPLKDYNVRFDYAPDLCKDYLETGYCGFGDSCKFLHDRGDYKMGWELDESTHTEQNYQIEEPTNPSLISCQLCQREHSAETKSKILPECQHRFCYQCITTALRKKLKCPLCKVPVSGIIKPI